MLEYTWGGGAMTEVKCPPTKTRISITQWLLLHVTFLHNLHHINLKHNTLQRTYIQPGLVWDPSPRWMFYFCVEKWEIVDRVVSQSCSAALVLLWVTWILENLDIPSVGNQLVGSNWQFDDSILFLWSFPNDIWGGEFYLLVIILQHNHKAPWHLTSADPSRCFSSLKCSDFYKMSIVQQRFKSLEPEVSS